MRMYSLTTRNRASGLLLALAVLGAGVALLLLGIALLATLAVAGAIVGSGVMLYRGLRRPHQPRLEESRSSATILDPALQVFPREATTAGRELPTFREDQR